MRGLKILENNALSDETVSIFYWYRQDDVEDRSRYLLHSFEALLLEQTQIHDQAAMVFTTSPSSKLAV